jgi:single-strand DNA-binding protein
MLNKVVLIGRLTKDPELRSTQGNIPFVNFTIAVNRPVSSTPQEGAPQQQDDRQTADFINCIAWRRQAETLAKYMRKGSMIAVDGRLAARDYMDKDNVRRFVTEVVADQIVFLETKSQTENLGSSAPARYQDRPAQNNYNQPSKQKNDNDLPIIEDDLPF